MPAHNFSPPRGETVRLTVASRALRGNLLGDPDTREVAVYLPEEHARPDARFPVFVDLAGFTGSGLKHLAWQAFGESVPQRIDRLVAAGAMGPVIAVFPDAFTSLGGNQYLDSIAMGRWEEFLIDEVVPLVEARFRTLPGREHRALFGKSSGGFGAISHGMRRADAWGAVACHSGDMAFDWVYRSEFPKTLDVLARHGRDIAAFLRAVAAKPKVGHDDLCALMMLAMAATYDPDPSAYRGIRLPVDLETCSLDPERWAAWLAHDPLLLADRPECQANLRRLAGLYFDCGARDQYALHYGARALTAKLARAGVPHRYEEFDDDHSSLDYRLDVSLPYLYAAVGAR